MFLSRTMMCRQGVMAFTRQSVASRMGRSATNVFHDRMMEKSIFRQQQSRLLRLSPQTTVALYSTTSPNPSDRSAISKSRAPFRMPKNSPDDSSTKQNQGTSQEDKSLSWNRLGLLTELCECLTNELKLPEPTPVQSLVIPQLLTQEKESMAFLAATGSGKTLAYVLPLMQQLKQQEVFEGYERRPKRPRILILAPTRELAVQITTVLKSMSHSVKLSTQALVGGQDKGVQRKALEGRPVDVVVATPGRLIYHWKNNNIFLGNIRTVVLDEMDTMLEQGFARELREILYPLLFSASPKEIDADTNTSPEVKDTAPQIVMTSATMTQSIQKLLGDNPKTSKLSISAKRLHTTGDGDQTTTDPRLYSKLRLPKMKIVSAPGLHKAVPRLEQVFIDVGNTDKMSLLLDVIASEKNKATIIFCNTASSVRAVQYALSEARIESIGYHGELNSSTRMENLQQFRKGARRAPSGTSDDLDDDMDDYSIGEDGPRREASILVCTDIGARGLDIPEVDSVIMFDFPLNAMDYLHRSGRTARGAGKGKVTALVAKRDKVLASAIEQAVLRGETLDGLSSRKTDYQPGARLGTKPKPKPTTKTFTPQKRRAGARRS
ncbi:ATP-dependent DEAD-box RNA helicase DeaD [Nitzschia inconspicua]|uniref:ATP-dependent DEAD-box RNA helicase DeaD n=1 Tax=Nitzschia inconspicua TaxID=303405 RepID=A0A9K3LQD4_9STRA|nr:ATP-dependent DEAD-box RNA helicase DeaD [Nitzschia inconspicua]